MGKLVVAAVVAVLALTMGLVTVVAAVGGAGASGSAGSASGSSGSGGTIGAGISAAEQAAVPARWLSLYQRAAATCPGLSWSVVAAIGTVETGSGQSTAAGVWSGANRAGAEGPMQFEPATFAAYATVGPGGVRPPSPYDPVDAVYTAAALLCADGAGSAGRLWSAVDDYNRSGTYVDTVLTLALSFEQEPSAPVTVVAALTFAAEQLGTPYLWGGTGPGGFDCSGLARAAYAHAGVVLPRVAQDQYDAGPPVPAGAPLEPGDLVFFGDGPSVVDHVGIYVGEGEMIDAPHTGAVVRFDSAGWSGLVGATRPG
jgi:cell wall-associated NlpC family hydrolase